MGLLGSTVVEMFADLPAEQIDADALRRAMRDGEREGLRLEFKSDFTKEDPEEFALDVTAFANTAGGVMLLGAVDTDMALSAFPGIAEPADDVCTRIDNTLRDRVFPALSGLHVLPVDVDDATVIVLVIPRSWRAPHLVKNRKRWSMARRNSSGKYPLQDEREVRAAYAEALQATTAGAGWHDAEVARFMAGDGQEPVEPRRGLVVTVRPLAAGAPGALPVLDVGAAVNSITQTLQPLAHGDGFGRAPNIDGVCVYDLSRPIRSYAQVYRDGSITFVDNYAVDRTGLKTLDDDTLPLDIEAVAMSLVLAFEMGPRSAAFVGARPPLAVEASLVGVRGRTALLAAANFRYSSQDVRADPVRLPGVMVETPPATEPGAVEAARPMLNALWNIAGGLECPWTGE